MYAAQTRELMEGFIARYLTKDEVRYRLPLQVNLEDFWQALQEERRRRGITLPLHTLAGQPFWFVLNDSITQQVDDISAAARRGILSQPQVLRQLQEDAVVEEAVYSSMIEGAFTTLPEAERLLKSNRKPRNKSERMVQNNYDALKFVLSHLEEDISKDTLVSIAAILTRDAAQEQVSGYRDKQVVVASTSEIVFTPPEAARVPGMMASLLDFIKTAQLHPVLKACAAHFYLVYVHPFSDGNGRTARALSLMILLQAGFDLFSAFPISALAAKERGKYYKAIKNVEDAQDDLTYFIDVYSGMLSRAVHQAEDLARKKLAEARWQEKLAQAGQLNQRQREGAIWLIQSGQEKITVEAWRKKFGVVTETARQDLLMLKALGLLTRQLDGRKAVFIINAIPE